MSNESQTPSEKSLSTYSKTSNTNTGMDPSNPYFVHHSDQPRHMLVPTKLNGANYPSWSKAMIHALTAKNKIGFINGSIQPPSEAQQPAEFTLWNQCNSMILSWLTHLVEPDLAKGVVHAKTAQQVWEDFKDRFSQKNASAIYQTQKSLASLSQGTIAVSSYFTKSKGLWDELETYRALPTYNQMEAHYDQREEDRMMQFLMGLNYTYNIVRTNILMMSPLPNVCQAYSLVIQEETQRQMTSKSAENFSIAATVHGQANNSSNNSKDRNCDHCNRAGHTIENCRTLTFHCKFCDKKGHTEEVQIKNGTWVLNNTGTQNNQHHQPQQQQRGSRGNGRNFFPADNVTDSSQPTHEGNLRDNNFSNLADFSYNIPQNSQNNYSSSKSSHGLSTEHLQQLAHAISMMNQNHASGSNNAYANATGLGYGEDDWLGQTGRWSLLHVSVAKDTYLYSSVSHSIFAAYATWTSVTISSQIGFFVVTFQ